MRWTKRLKWLRASKIIIPIALAISLIFAGFTVYAHKAENFVVRINAEDDVKLALTFNRDLSEQTTHLVAPILGRYEDVTYTENNLEYNPKKYSKNLPNDIARHDGVHPVYEFRNQLSFYSFSFWLVNNSDRAVDVDMRLNIDEMTVHDKESDVHIDGAARVMLIEGEPLLSDKTYTVYKKPEANEANQKVLDEAPGMYGNTVSFASDSCVFNREGDLGYRNLAKGGTIRFTIVLWLEGWDVECVDEIRRDSLKMSLEFQGY